MINQLFHFIQVKEQATVLCAEASPASRSDSTTLLDWANNLSTAVEAQKLSCRLHLLSLLFEVRFPLFTFVT